MKELIPAPSSRQLSTPIPTVGEPALKMSLRPFEPTKVFCTIVKKLTLIRSGLSFEYMEIDDFKTFFAQITPEILIKFIKKLNNQNELKILKRDYEHFFNANINPNQILAIQKATEECQDRLNSKRKKKGSKTKRFTRVMNAIIQNAPHSARVILEETKSKQNLTNIPNDNYNHALSLVIGMVSEAEESLKIEWLNLLILILKKNPNLTKVDQQGDTPLLAAMRKDNPQAAKLILENDSKQDYINIHNNDLFTPLSGAIFKISKEKNLLKQDEWLNLIHLILSKNPDLTKINKLGDTPLLEALRENCLPVAKLILETDSKQDYINIHDIASLTPLSCAMFGILQEKDLPKREEWLNLTRLILRKNPDLTKTNGSGDTPLLAALSYNCLPVAKLILETDSKQDYINIHNNDLFTPLRYAIFKISKEKDLLKQEEWLYLLRVILNKNPDLTKVDSSGDTPLIFAIQLNCYKAARLILEVESKDDYIDITNNMNSDPFCQVILQANKLKEWLDLIPLILKKNLNLKKQYSTVKNRTPLMFVISRGFPEIAHLILETQNQTPSEYINIIDKGQDTALTLAVSNFQLTKNHQNLITALIRAGANLTIRGREGETAFMQAIQVDNPRLTLSTLILEVSRNSKEYMDIQSDFGSTALMILLYNFYSKIKKLERSAVLNLLNSIIKNSSNINLFNKHTEICNVLQLAVHYQDIEVATLLLKAGAKDLFIFSTSSQANIDFLNLQNIISVAKGISALLKAVITKSAELTTVLLYSCGFPQLYYSGLDKEEKSFENVCQEQAKELLLQIHILTISQIAYKNNSLEIINILSAYKEQNSNPKKIAKILHSIHHISWVSPKNLEINRFPYDIWNIIFDYCGLKFLPAIHTEARKLNRPVLSVDKYVYSNSAGLLFNSNRSKKRPLETAISNHSDKRIKFG